MSSNPEKLERTLGHDLFGLRTKRKGVNSKQKGARGELAICKLLRKWSGYDFNRVPRSGGLRWADSSRIAGDIVAETSLDFPFVIEVKNYENLSITETTIGKKSTIYKFWSQAVTDAQRVDKQPLLLAKDNTTDFMLFTTQDVVTPASKLMVIHTKGITLHVYKFKEIIDKLSFEEFIEFFR